LLHLVGFDFIALPTLKMHGQTQIKVLMKSTDQTLKYTEILNSYRWGRDERMKIELQEIGCGHGLD
jgi:hypothetical protein